MRLFLFTFFLLTIGGFCADTSPCGDFACDSAVVRLILDLNRHAEVQVTDVTNITEARVIGLSLQYMGLDTVPPDLGRLTALVRLGLDRNNLHALPAEIGLLDRLTVLQLDNNVLSHLPPEIGQLKSLTALIAFSNRLEALPPEIGRLSALSDLRLDHNALSGLPPEIQNLAALATLDVDDNRLCGLSDSMSTWVDRFSINPDWSVTQSRDGTGACAVGIGSENRPKGKPVFRAFRTGKDLALEFDRAEPRLITVYDARGNVLRTYHGSRPNIGWTGLESGMLFIQVRSGSHASVRTVLP